MKTSYLYIIAASLFFVVACNEDDPDVKKTNTVDLAGEWWVTYKVDDGSGNLVDVGGGYTGILTSNTASNTASEILITDYVDPNATSGNFWSYTVKAQANVSALTFTGNESLSSALYEEEPYPIKVNVLKGQVLKGLGLSKTKVKVDSIYFELQFSDDKPAYATTFIVSGHKRTGFYEDEY